MKNYRRGLRYAIDYFGNYGPYFVTSGVQDAVRSVGHFPGGQLWQSGAAALGEGLPTLESRLAILGELRSGERISTSRLGSLQVWETILTSCGESGLPHERRMAKSRGRVKHVVTYHGLSIPEVPAGLAV